MSYQPLFTIMPRIIDLISQIREMVGRLAVHADGEQALRLRRINRIRTIQLEMILRTVSATPQVSLQVTPQVTRMLEVLHGEMTMKSKKAGFAALGWGSTNLHGTLR